MPKKSQRQQLTEAQLIAWYKWEFLRRNVEYRKDYEEFVREFGGWFEVHGYWYDRTTEPWGSEDLRFFMAVIAPKAKVICEKWEIQNPFPPEWVFTTSGAYCYKPHYKVFLPTDCDNESAGALWDFSDLLLSFDEFAKTLPESESTARRRGPRPAWHLSLGFDLRLPLSSLLREAKDRITSSKKRYVQTHPRTAPVVRRRLDRYKVYLEVWDRKSGGEKYLSIGVDLFGSKPRVEQRAIDSFKRAQELIGGGYKELR